MPVGRSFRPQPALGRELEGLRLGGLRLPRLFVLETVIL